MDNAPATNTDSATTMPTAEAAKRAADLERQVRMSTRKLVQAFEQLECGPTVSMCSLMDVPYVDPLTELCLYILEERMRRIERNLLGGDTPK